MNLYHTASSFKNDINFYLKGKGGSLFNIDTVVRRAVSQVMADADLRSLKREAPIASGLYFGVYDYSCPTDLKGNSVIDLVPQVDRKALESYNLVFQEEFNRRKERGTYAINERNNIKTISISADVDSQNIGIEGFETLGSWIASGDAANVQVNSEDYLHGVSSIVFDINSVGGTTAGVKNTSLTETDLTAYENEEIFVNTYLTKVTGVNKFTLRIGSSQTNYYEIEASKNNESTAFQDGWNLIRFDLSNKVKVGTPDISKITFVEVILNKETTKINETGFRFDCLIARKGKEYSLKYYSKFPWQNVAGNRIEKTTADTDFLIAEDDEYELYLSKALEMSSVLVEESMLPTYRENLANYVTNYPSEAAIITSTYYQF